MASQQPRFHLFRKLPTEIRFKIWKLYLDDQEPDIVEVILDNPSNNVSSKLQSRLLPLQNPHHLLKICYESYVEAQRYLKPLRFTPHNNNINILEIFVRVSDFILYLHPLNMIVYHSEICFQKAPINILAINYTRDSISESISVIRKFGSVQMLYIVLNDKWAFDPREEGVASGFFLVDESLGDSSTVEAYNIKMEFVRRMAEAREIYSKGWSIPEVKCVMVSRKGAGTRI